MALAENQVANTVDRVKDGAEALAYLRRQGDFADRPRPDVVLLDLKLPKISGHEVLAEVKKDPELQTVPIVVLTTSEAEIDRAKAYGNHANSYLTKPVDFDQFAKMIQDLKLYWCVWNRPPA